MESNARRFGARYVGEVAEAPDRQELLTALTTEHFTLQGARSQTMGESSARASVYVFAVSSALVALGFIGQTRGSWSPARRRAATQTSPDTGTERTEAH